MALSAAAQALFEQIIHLSNLHKLMSFFVEKGEFTLADMVIAVMQQNTTEMYQKCQSPAGIVLFQEVIGVYPELGRGFLLGFDIIARQGGPQNDLTCNLANIIRGTNN